MRYDNIEIGTSDFRTLIESAKGNGISIEPVPCYFNNLPDRDDWIKLEYAISDRDDLDTMYYVNPDKITDEPHWVRGCNSLGKPHVTIEQMFPHLMESRQVLVVSVQTLIDVFDITEVGYLKIDTEGHDIKIMNALLDTNLRPEKILFESNVLIDTEQLSKLLKRLHEYKCKPLGTDMLCERLPI